MNILFLKFFGENFKKIATENPLGFNILSTNVKFIVNFKENTISLKHYNPSSSTKLLELSFTYVNAGQIKQLKIKSVNSFKFVKQNDNTLVYTKPNNEALQTLNIPDQIRTAINPDPANAAAPLGTITETPQNNPNMICLAVEFESASAQINTGFTATTDIKITANYWNFTTMASRMDYDATTSQMDYDEDNSIKIDFNEYSQKELNEFINEGIISKDQLNNYNASLSTNSKDTNLYSLRLNSTKSTLIIETKANEANILKLGTYAPQQGATADNAKILSDMLTPDLVKLNNDALTIKKIEDGTETVVATIAGNNQTTLNGLINGSLGINNHDHNGATEEENTAPEVLLVGPGGINTNQNTEETDKK